MSHLVLNRALELTLNSENDLPGRRQSRKQSNLLKEKV